MKKIMILAALAALSLASCQKKDGEIVGNVTRYVGAEIGEMTKTTLDAPEAGGTVSVVWSEGDEIGVVVAGTTTIRKGTISAGAGTSVATFAIADAVADEEYSYAIYPYSYAGTGGSTAPTISGSVFTVKLPVRQPFYLEDGVYGDKVFASNVNTMVGKFEGDKVQFESLCGVIEVQLNTTDAVETKVFSIELQSDSQKMSGLSTIDMSGDEPVLTVGSTTESYNMVFKASGQDLKDSHFPLTTGQTRSVYFCVPAKSYSDLKISTCVSGTSTILAAKKAHTVQKCVITRLPVYDPVNVNRSMVEDAIDLCVDSEGNAAYSNCYMVPISTTDKTYRIKRCYSDDSEVFKTPNGTTAFEMVKYPSHIVPIWESKNGLITKVLRIQNDLYFTVKANTSGNAMLTTLTSTMAYMHCGWHIWVTNAQDQTLVGGKTFLNCNLGATYAPSSLEEAQAMTTEQVTETFGCFYQWGNPVPKAAGSASLATNQEFKNNTWTFHKFIYNQYCQIWTTSSNMTANPYDFTNYFYSGTSGQWTTLAFFANTGTGALWKSTEKTMFDPCPLGYRVPSREEFGRAFTNTISGSNGKTYTKIDAKMGAYLTGEVANNSFIWWPWTGVRVSRGVKTTHTSGIVNYTGRLINDAVSSYPRSYHWIADDYYTSDNIYYKRGTTNAINIRYAGGTGGRDNAAAASDAPYVYPVATFEYGVAKTASTFSTALANPYLDAQVMYVSSGNAIRCVKIE